VKTGNLPLKVHNIAHSFNSQKKRIFTLALKGGVYGAYNWLEINTMATVLKTLRPNWRNRQEPTNASVYSLWFGRRWSRHRLMPSVQVMPQQQPVR